MVYWELFIAFVKIGVLGFGGGMAIISLIQNEVLSYGWMSETEFVDIVAISQVTPGPIGMNCATYVGYTAGGIIGSLVASVSIVLPSLAIMLTLCKVYDKLNERWHDNRVYQVCMRIVRCLVVMLIAFAAWRMMTPATFVDKMSWGIFGVVFVCMCVPEFIPAKRPVSVAIKKTADIVSHPILLICLAGLAGYLIYA